MSDRTMEDLRDTCDKVRAILKKTKNGSLLDPRDFKLTELAVNGYLDPAGREIFEKLYQTVVTQGAYIKPYLHGIEHISRDHEGYIYYKGAQVEHYDSDYVYSEDAKNSLLELKRRCEFLERKGIAVSAGSAIWGWEQYADEYGQMRLEELETLLGGFGLRYSRVRIVNSCREYQYIVCGGEPGLEQIKDHPVTKSMIGRYFDDEYEINIENFAYGSGRHAQHSAHSPGDAASHEIQALLYSCHNYLSKHEMVERLSETVYNTDFAEGYDRTMDFIRDVELSSDGPADADDEIGDGYEP